MKKFFGTMILSLLLVHQIYPTRAFAKPDSLQSDEPTAAFLVNGDTTHLPPDYEDDDPLSGNFYLSSKKLNLVIAARIAPEVSLTLKIFSIEFDTNTLNQSNAIGMLLRRNSNMENLLTYNSNYTANGQQGFLKLTITKYTLQHTPSKNSYGEAIISGTFEGDLLCSPSACGQAQTQHLTSGQFENVKIEVWN